MKNLKCLVKKEKKKKIQMRNHTKNLRIKILQKIAFCAFITLEVKISSKKVKQNEKLQAKPASIKN